VAGYDPQDGRQLWIVNGPTEQYVASPVLADGVLIVTYGYPKHGIAAIDPRGSGNVTASHLLWQDAKDYAYVPSPVAVGRNVYIVSDTGKLICIAAVTGNKAYAWQLGKAHYPSGVYAGGNLYFLADSGETFVVRPGEKFQLLARNPIGEDCRASPAVSDGQIFLRGSRHLFCIGQPAAPPAKLP